MSTTGRWLPQDRAKPCAMCRDGWPQVEIRKDGVVTEYLHELPEPAGMFVCEASDECVAAAWQRRMDAVARNIARAQRREKGAVGYERRSQVYRMQSDLQRRLIVSALDHAAVLSVSPRRTWFKMIALALGYGASLRTLGRMRQRYGDAA